MTNNTYHTYKHLLPTFCSTECADTANDAGRFYGEWQRGTDCEECGGIPSPTTEGN